ncbi:hypothetical protein ACFQY3_24730 [Paenibacillus farraposensis]|uniref:hypothetical protein n=1 Tax=Paenibacillus farraposensis TaxID=2807095 RepID=UPI00361B20F4
MSRPGNDEKQLDLIYDYQTNVKMYPQFRQYLQERQPPFLAAWGKNDVLSIPEGAKAFKKGSTPCENLFTGLRTLCLGNTCSGNRRIDDSLFLKTCKARILNCSDVG